MVSKPSESPVSGYHFHELCLMDGIRRLDVMFYTAFTDIDYIDRRIKKTGDGR